MQENDKKTDIEKYLPGNWICQQVRPIGMTHLDLADNQLRHELKVRDILYDIKFNFAGAQKIILRCPGCRIESVVDFRSYFGSDGAECPERLKCEKCGVELAPVIRAQLSFAQQPECAILLEDVLPGWRYSYGPR